jgi:hypothetical protein
LWQVLVVSTPVFVYDKFLRVAAFVSVE